VYVYNINITVKNKLKYKFTIYIYIYIFFFTWKTVKILKKGEQLFKRVFPNTYFYKISINLKNKKIVLILYLNKNLQFDFFYSSFFFKKLKYYFVSLWTPLTIQMKSTNWRIINIHRISPDWNALMSHLSLVLWNMNGQDLFLFFH
jgi:hypothetical protein